MGDPSNWQILKENSGPEKLFFIFPSRHPWEQAVSLSGAFPAAQSAVAMGDPSNWQILKENFSEPEKLFFDFPLQTPLRAGSELFRCFSSCPPTGQEKNQGLKNCFFAFPLQTPLRAGSELFRCFSSCPKRSCNGRPFQLANFKRKLFRAWEVVFWFSSPDTFESRQWAFQVLFQLPTNRPRKKIRAWKIVFFAFPLQTPLRAGSELFRCFSSCPKRSCNGRPFQLANFKRKLFRAWKVVFWFSPPENFKGSGKLCHRPTPVTCLNPLGPTKTERTPNVDGTRRANKFRI